MRYRFGQFELDVSTRELTADGERRETEPKAFDLLAYLLEHRDRAVSKDELLESLWPRQIVTETALTRAVMKARRAVDDDASRQSVIRTVHGHGYRFVPELEAAASEPESPDAGEGSVEAAAAQVAPPADAAAAPRSFDRMLGVAVAVAAFAAIAVIAATAWFGARPVAAGAVAVLPVDNRVESTEYQWVRLGLMSLAQRMLEESGIDVVADRSVLSALGDDALTAPPGVELSERLRRQTGADSLLYTLLERDGGLFRLSAVLQTPDGRRTRRIIVGDAPAELAADMSELFASLLAGGTSPAPDRFSRTSTDPFVNEVYARALDLELAGSPEEARQLFRVAAEQDPDLFWLRYEIALCTRDLREWDEATRQFEDLYAEARAGSDPRAMIVTLNSHGVMELNRNRYDAAEQLFRAADRHAAENGLPSDRATVNINLALIATRRGRFDDADGHYEAALDAWEAAEMDPPPTFLNNYAGHLLRQGRLTEARSFSERAVTGFRVRGHRRFEAPSLNRLGRILARLGDIDGSIEKHRESLSISRDLGNVRGELSAAIALTSAHRARGDLTRARIAAEDALDRAEATDDELVLGDVVMEMGQLEADSRNFEDATRHFERALGIFEPIGDDAGLYGARRAIAEAALEAGDIERAEQLARELLDEATENAQPTRIANLELLLGRVFESRGDLERAADRYGQSLAFARDQGDMRLLPAAAIRLGNLELSRGNLEAAASLVGEAGPHARIDRDLMRLEARLALARDDRAGALEALERLRDAARETWTESDQQLLEAARNPARSAADQPCDSSRPNSILRQRSMTTSSSAARALAAASGCARPI